MKSMNIAVMSWINVVMFCITGAQYHQQSSEATLDTESKCPPGDQDCVLDSLEEQSVKVWIICIYFLSRCFEVLT